MISILHINTALADAYAAVSVDDVLKAVLKNPDQKSHASFLHPAIKEVLSQVNIDILSLDAVSVILGPGSYTGLRVGLAAAKGICFAGNIPLITVNTLEWLVQPALRADYEFFIPMIDARRNEVFTAIYDRYGNELEAPHAVILDESTFRAQLETGKVLFLGDGAAKAQPVIRHGNAGFDVTFSATSMEQTQISIKRFLNKTFSNLIYTEPLYAKEFYTPSHKP